jgi:hypothetical protein
MLTNYTAVYYSREALTTTGSWCLTMDGGALLECGHDEAIKWFDENCKNNEFCRYSNLRIKQLTEKELEYVREKNRHGFLNALMKTAAKIQHYGMRG